MKNSLVLIMVYMEKDSSSLENFSVKCILINYFSKKIFMFHNLLIDSITELIADSHNSKTLYKEPILLTKFLSH